MRERSWQYRVEKYSLEELERPGYLDPLGDEGWELVCMKRIEEDKPAVQTQWLAVFKRPSTPQWMEEVVTRVMKSKHG